MSMQTTSKGGARTTDEGAIRSGTSMFRSRDGAIRYYRPYYGRAAAECVDEKIRDGAISIVPAPGAGYVLDEQEDRWVALGQPAAGVTVGSADRGIAWGGVGGYTGTIGPGLLETLRLFVLDAEDMTVRPPTGRRLPASEYAEAKKVILMAGGTWRAGRQVFTFENAQDLENMREALARGTVVNHQKRRQAFYTPPALAAQVVGLANLLPFQTLLEPSAGDGALVLAAVTRMSPIHGPRITAIEFDPAAAEGLRAFSWPRGAHPDVVCADFLSWSGGPFDRVVMNPPFTRGQDVKHVAHALTLLAPGGLLVAVTSLGLRTSKGWTEVARAELAAGALIAYHDVPSGTFAESGTDVATQIVVVTRKHRPAADQA